MKSSAVEWTFTIGQPLSAFSAGDNPCSPRHPAFSKAEAKQKGGQRSPLPSQIFARSCLCSGGHSKGGVVFYIPEHKFLMLADETTAMPIWPDTDPRRVISTAQKALTMSDNGGLEWLCAGHFPMAPSNDPKELQASLHRILGQADQFSETVEKEVAAHPEGLTVDELYEALRKDIPSTSYLTFLIANQFPVFTTFMKLTLLNHLLLYNFPSRNAPQGYIRFLPLVRE